MEKDQKNDAGCGSEKTACGADGPTEFLPIYNEVSSDEVCCGPPPGPASSEYERPGYALCSFVETFRETAAGSVPRIKTRLTVDDHIGSIKVRLGINRSQYKVAPGLYSLGDASAASPVLVTANYKLTFDILRRELTGESVWILVLDARGVNVWCAAGKRTFSTEEVIRQVKQTRLQEVVSHKKLILPQLSATGVSAKQVRKGCGFKVVWGPIRAVDIAAFLSAGLKAEKPMRLVTFTMLERLVLVPVELFFLRKYLLWILLTGFLLSGIGSSIFSFNLAWSRGLILIMGCAAGVFAGAVAAPLLLPWIPVRAFAVKGSITGLVMAAMMLFVLGNTVNLMESAALVLLIGAVSSYLAMNFTGSTPYTSPSGVEKEMRLAIPVQTAAMILAVAGWIGSTFIAA
jgi:CO dehydrogenase/acetyl-CoA synthase delta subunit